MGFNPKKIASGAATVVAAAGTLSLLTATLASAAGVNAGPAQVVTPLANGNAPLSAGGSATQFSLKLPAGAACTGDSANGGYRVQSYMVPSSVDPSTLSFDDTGPTGPVGAFSEPLYDLGGSPYVNIQTANADVAGGPGLIINIPAFSYFVYEPPPSAFAIPPGTYNIGIACTLGPVGPTQQDKFYNVQKTFTANPADSPAQVTWVVTGGPTPVVPEVPLAVLLPLTTLALLGGGTMVLRRRRSAVLA